MSTNQTNVNSFNRARRDYHAVGKCIPKKDSSQLLLGKPVFTDDITPRDALVIKLLRSPYANAIVEDVKTDICLLYTSPSPRDRSLSRMPSSA